MGVTVRVLPIDPAFAYSFSKVHKIRPYCSISESGEPVITKHPMASYHPCQFAGCTEKAFAMWKSPDESIWFYCEQHHPQILKRIPKTQDNLPAWML